MNSIGIAIFESTRMSCDLMSRALSESQHRLRVIYADTPQKLLTGSQLKGVEVALVSSNHVRGSANGPGLLQRLSKIDLAINCVLLLDQDDRQIVTDAFRAGAVGIFQRDQPYEQLVKCIRCVQTGQVWASSQQLRYALGAFAGGQLTGHLAIATSDLLSKREKEIVAKVAEGLKNREIADLLCISENTIKNHLFRIFGRLGISSRAELILYAHGHRMSAEYAARYQRPVNAIRQL